MNEIHEDASLIARGAICKCRQCITDANVPTTPNKNENLIKAKLKRMTFRETQPLTQHWKQMPDGTWKNIKQKK